MKEQKADWIYRRTGIYYRNWVIMGTVFVLFVLSGFLHVYTAHADYTSCLMQFLNAGVVIYWAVTITRRIIDRRVRYMLLTTATFLLLYFILQICKYTLFDGIGMIPRYLWYSYYIPMTGVPMTLFFISLYMNLQEDETIARGWWFLLIPSTTLMLGFITNEYHNLAFRFPEGATPYNDIKEYGMLSLFFWIFVLFLLLGAMTIALHKCRLTVSRKLMWVPMLPILFGSVWLALDALDLNIRIHGIPFLNIPEVFAFMAIGFLENCIQIGIIPANFGYEKLFEMTMVPAVIVDKAGRRVYTTAGAQDGNLPEEETVVRSKSIFGGSVRWAVDLSEINALNRELEEVTEQIETRNKYLKTQNDLKAEQTAIEARTKVYDRITEILRPQLQKIETLTKDEEHFEEHLAEITVYNAYVKRRSNLELVQDEESFLPLSELLLSVKESMDYLHLYGVETLASGIGNGRYAAGAILLAYEFFEYVIETTMTELRMVSTTILGDPNRLTLRMMLQTTPEAEPLIASLDSAWRADDLATQHGRIETSRDGLDVWMILSMDISQVPEERGGDAS